ncbi:MAG: hypothetical protein ABH986_04905 [archaeon]
MEKKLVYGVIVFVIFLFLAFILYDSLFSPTDSITYPKEITHEEKYCERDNDCKIVNLGCCQEFSNPKPAALNEIGRQKIAEWKTENCVPCRMEESVVKDYTVLTKATCKENSCKITYEPGCAIISMYCSENNIELTSDQLNKLGMTKEEVLEYCGC